MALQDSFVFYRNNTPIYSFSCHVLPKDYDIVFSFNENEPIYLSTQTNNYELYLETGEKDDSCFYRGMKKFVGPLDKVEISNSDNSLFPNKYCIWLGQKGKLLCKCFFEVRPTVALDDDGAYDKLRDILISCHKNLIYDYSRATSFTCKEVKKQGKADALTVSETLLDKKDRLVAAIRSILQNPIAQAKKEIRPQPGNRTNEKTEMLSDRYEKEYSYHTEYDVQNKENRTILFYAWETEKELALINQTIARFLVLKKKELREKNDLVKRLVNKPNLVEERNNLVATIQRYENYLTNNKAIQKALDNLLFAPQFKYVRPAKMMLTKKMLKNKDYHFIYQDLYLLTHQCIEYKEKTNFLTPTSYGIKSTSDLYELYVLLFLMNLVVHLGYSLTEEVNFETLGITNENYTIHFLNGEKHCRLVFDKEIEETANNDLIHFTRGSSHHRPDYQLIFTDKNENAEYIAVLDAKCRSLERIDVSTKQGANNYIETVKDYMSFKYHKDNEPLMRAHSVDDLFFLYPEKRDQKLYSDNLYGVNYLVIRPTDAMEEDESFKILLDHIQSHLSNPS